MQQLLNLCKKARSLQDYKLADLAEICKVEKPEHNITAKGWSGQLIEQLLGVKNNSFSGPDFPELGVELKTIPVSVDYKPFETTYITTVPLLPKEMTSFEDSILYAKLRCVLWIPLIAKTKTQAVTERVVGRAVLWQPNEKELNIIQQDFFEIMEYIVSGEIDSLNAQVGQYLHVRPKALNSKKRTYTLNSDGEYIQTSPKGFYLRTSLTREILCDLI